MKCLIIPLGKFGDHDLGYTGCTWCDQKEACIKKNPNKGKSLIMKQTAKKFRRKKEKI